MLSTPKKVCRVIVYGTLGTACFVALLAALAIPDEFDVFEAQIAAVYLALIIGSNKTFNAKPIFGSRILGMVAMLISHGLLPATIIHVALAQIESGQSAHWETLIGYGMVTAGSALLFVPVSWIPLMVWEGYENKRQHREEKQRQRLIETTPGWVPRLD